MLSFYIMHSSQTHKSQMMGLLIALLILCMVGFLVVFFKIDLNHSSQISGENLLSRRLDRLEAEIAYSQNAITALILPEDQSKTTASVMSAAMNPLIFSTKGLDVHVIKNVALGRPDDFAEELTLESLKGMATECGRIVQMDAYYRSIIGRLASAPSVEYEIIPNQSSQEPTFKVYALANGPGYKNLDAVKTDLDVCGSGGIYPVAVDSKWIVFTGSCGGATDAALPPAACGKIQSVVSPTIKLVE